MVGQPIVDIMANVKTLPQYAIRYFAVMIGGALALAIIGFVYVSVFDLDVAKPSARETFIGYIYGGVVLTYLGLILDGVITFLGAAAVCAARWGIAIAAGTMWRVSLYPKGPLAAVSALILAFLAVLRIVLGVKNK